MLVDVLQDYMTVEYGFDDWYGLERNVCMSGRNVVVDLISLVPLECKHFELRLMTNNDCNTGVLPHVLL